MNFDLADLRAFLAVADLSSFRAASEALHLSQSRYHAVSKSWRTRWACDCSRAPRAGWN